LRAGAEAAVAGVAGVVAAEVRLTWDPPWTPGRIAAAG
jgi:metal-sulfur cluster biosynthetic enzyme